MKNTIQCILAVTAPFLVVLSSASCYRPDVPTPQGPNPGDPLPGLTQTELSQFHMGKILFEREFTIKTGLGPKFNSVSCRECHEHPETGGSGANELGGDDVETHASKFQNNLCNELESDGGPVFRHNAINDGQLDNIPPSTELGVGHRTTPPLFGFGLIENIPDETLVNLQPYTGGHVHRLPNGNIGRFGRKATDPNLTSFIHGAFSKEQGIEIPSELSQEDLELTVKFVQLLAPVQRLKPDKNGQFLFKAIGCTKCHVPTLHTGCSLSLPVSKNSQGQQTCQITSSVINALEDKDVDLYSDLLLHDMGAVDMCRGDAKPNEFRTAPLMGMRFLKTFMHDGRAKNVEDAIDAHAGQAKDARNRFNNLSDTDKARIVRFVKSL